MRTLQAYRFALDLTPGQERAVLAHAGAARFAFNWALERVKAVMAQRAAERSDGVAEEQLTPALGWSLPALRKGVERRQEGSGAVVGAVFEGSVQHRPGRARPWVDQLDCFPHRQAGR